MHSKFALKIIARRVDIVGIYNECLTYFRSPNSRPWHVVVTPLVYMVQQLHILSTHAKYSIGCPLIVLLCYLLYYFIFLPHFVTDPTKRCCCYKLSTERNLHFISILTISLIHCNEHRAHAYDKLYMPPVPL